MHLILYSKPGCHLCENLEEKLAQVQAPPFNLPLELEIRDITTRDEWFQAYQSEIPLLFYQGSTQPLPRLSPRAPVTQLAQMLQTHLPIDPAK